MQMQRVSTSKCQQGLKRSNNQTNKVLRVGYGYPIFLASNKNFEERESSIEILSKVVLKVFLWKTNLWFLGRLKIEEVFSQEGQSKFLVRTRDRGGLGHKSTLLLLATVFGGGYGKAQVGWTKSQINTKHVMQYDMGEQNDMMAVV